MEFRRGDYTLALVLVYSKKLKSKGRVFCACCYKRLKLRLQLFRIRHSYNIMIMYCIFGKIFEQLEVIFMFSMCCFSRTLVFWLEPGNISRGSMGRVPALKAESVFYFLRQEKRKRRDAIAKLEYKMMYFYNETKMNVKNMIVDGDVDLPSLPIRETKKKEYEKEDNGKNCIDNELMQWHNNAGGDHEDNFNS